MEQPLTYLCYVEHLHQLRPRKLRGVYVARSWSFKLKESLDADCSYTRTSYVTLSKFS